MTPKTATPATVGVDDRGQKSVTIKQNNATETAKNQVKFDVDVILRAVTAYHEKSIHTFPLNRDKFPVVKEWNDHDFTIEQHRVDGFHGLGSCPGRWPGNVMVFDVGGPQGRKSWAKCLEQYGPLPETYTVTTGRVEGGEHLYFQVPDGLYVKSTASKFAKKVDIRGTRGQAVLPPTVHKSGKIYQWHYAGKPCEIPDPAEIPLLPETWIKALTDTDNAYYPELRPPAPPPRPYIGNTGAYASKALEGEINRVLSAPEGTRNVTLNNAAFSLGQLVAGGELDHGTVQAELLSAALSAGLPERKSLRTIESGFKGGAKSPRRAPEQTYSCGGADPAADFRQATGGTGNQDKLDTWEKPIPLESETAPPMDPEILPGALRDIVVEVDRATETPPELGTGMGTAVVATCCQGKMIIEPRPGYWEPLSLFTVTALDSANRKSGVTSIMTEPLRAAELEMWAKAEPFIKEMASRQKNIESRLKSLRAKYGKAKADELREIENEIQEMERQVEPVPPLPRLWADDVTPEHLGTMMHQHNERMSILSAEGGIFDILAGLYSNGIPNMEVFLKGHACEPGRVDRGSREPVFLDAPCLTIGLAPQPAVLRGLTGKPGFRGRGLLARFLYFLPASRLGYRTLKTDPVPERVKQAWGNLISQLLSIEPRLDEHDRETPYIIKLSTEALSEWEDFSQAVEVEMRPGGRFEPIKDWAGKLPGAATRIAGLFHCIENPGAPWADPVTGETMTQALNLSAVYADHALVAFGLMGGDPALEGAKKVWRWIETGRHRQFSKRDCFQALRGTFTRVKEIEEPVSVLIERNYIRTEAVKTGGSKGGRPTEVITVNPEIVRGWA